jgi:hypothetical protein
MEDVEAASGVVLVGSCIALTPRCRNCREMHDRIGLTRMVVQTEKGVQRLAEVGKVDLHGVLVCAW